MKMNWKSVSVFGLLILFAGTFVLGSLKSCKTEVPQVQEETTLPNTEFVAEGELVFLKSDTSIAPVKITIEIAETEGAITQGLMYRKSMDFDKGMLFIFPNNEERSFWMKNTIIPLDIIYVSEEKAIVSIKDHTTPYSTTSIPSDGQKAKYVIEVNAGFAGTNGLKVGDKVDFSRF